jgi:hypothetical protein
MIFLSMKAVDLPNLSEPIKKQGRPMEIFSVNMAEVYSQ